MDLARYVQYVAACNSQNWDLVHREFYAKDLQLVTPVGRLSGRATSLAWYKEAHQEIFETHSPMTIDFLENGRRIVADLWAHFILLGDTTLSPGGPGEYSDVVDIPMQAKYRVDDDDKFTKVEIVFTAPPAHSRLHDHADKRDPAAQHHS
jgi:hypothetical protein